MAKNKKGPWDDISRGFKTFNKIVYEVSGAGDVKRFAKKPNLKTGASLGLTIAAYAAGPYAKGAQAAKAAKAATAVERTMEARAAAAAARAATETRAMKAFKGAGAVTTKSGAKIPMTGIQKFETGKSAARAAASTRSMVARQAESAAKTAARQAEKKVTASKIGAASLATGKATSTYSTEKQKRNNKKK